MFNDAVKQSTRRICIGSKIVEDVELYNSIITWHKTVANEWCNTEDWCNTVEWRNSDEWCRCIDEWCTTMLLLLEPSSSRIDQRELRSSRSPRSVPYGKHSTCTISDNHILEITLQTINCEVNQNGESLLINNHLNYSKMLELIQKSSGDQQQLLTSQQQDGVIGSATQKNS